MFSLRLTSSLLLRAPQMCEFTSLVVQTRAKELAYLCSQARTPRMTERVQRIFASLSPHFTSTLPPLE